MAIAGQVIANILFLLAGYAIECKYHKHTVGYPVGSKIVTRLNGEKIATAQSR